MIGVQVELALPFCYRHRHGQVGGGQSGQQAFPNSIMAELSPTDRGLMARGGETNVNVGLSVAYLAREVNRYNAKQARRGK